MPAVLVADLLPAVPANTGGLSVKGADSRIYTTGSDGNNIVVYVHVGEK